MAEQIKAPFTPEQVANLNAYQAARRFHPFTCGGDRKDADHVAYQAQHPRQDFGQLVATQQGWECPVPGCTYTQDWAHGFMATPLPPRRPLRES